MLHMSRQQIACRITPKELNPYAGQYEMRQTTLKMNKTQAHKYSSESTQRELSNEYQHDRVYSFFKKVCVLVVRMKVASALEGLRNITYGLTNNFCI